MSMASPPEATLRPEPLSRSLSPSFTLVALAGRGAVGPLLLLPRLVRRRDGPRESPDCGEKKLWFCQ